MLEKERIPVIVLKGAALAETVYENPVLRHCHDTDLLVKHEDLDKAATLLSVLTLEAATGDRNLEHESGLPLELHTSLFQISCFSLPLTELWQRSERRIVSGASALARVQAFFDWHHHVDAYDVLYRRLIGRKSTSQLG